MDGYEQYDLQDEDPYLIAGSTCLDNLLGISDTQSLNEAEAALSEIALAELIATPITPTFDLLHLQSIHRHLFSDIYAWAGELRQTEIAKGGLLFLPYRSIEADLSHVLTDLHMDNLLQGLDAADFVKKAAYYLGSVNRVHPFREGNGRTQRIMFDQLAELSGFAFQWSAVSGEQMALACRAARRQPPDYAKLERLLTISMTRL